MLDLVCGTPGYIAPEVYHYNYNEKCDCFSLGILLLELISGRK